MYWVLTFIYKICIFKYSNAIKIYKIEINLEIAILSYRKANNQIKPKLTDKIMSYTFNNVNKIYINIGYINQEHAF